MQALDFDELESWFRYGDTINMDGSGSAHVVTDPDNPTICARFSTWDRPYRDFAEMIFYDHICSENLPKMYAFEENGDEYVVVLEVLEHLCEDDVLWQLCAENWNTRWVDAYGDGDPVQAVAEILDAFDGDRPEMITVELLELQAELYDLSFDVSCCMDIHEFNVMVRPGKKRDAKGRFQKCSDVAVITDPWC
jgi:hypothetical protein